MNDTLSNEFKKNVYLKPDEYLNGWARKCRWKATLVYDSLWRHADKNRQSFPSIELISQEHGVGERTIIRGLKTLIEYNLVIKESKRNKQGKFLHNSYTLTDKSKWKDVSRCPTDTRLSRCPTVQTQVPQGHHKDTHKKDTHNNGNNGDIVDKIKRWAYERAYSPPSCSPEAFEKSVRLAIERSGEEKVTKIFEKSENAIKFLVDIKNL